MCRFGKSQLLNDYIAITHDGSNRLVRQVVNIVLPPRILLIVLTRIGHVALFPRFYIILVFEGVGGNIPWEDSARVGTCGGLPMHAICFAPKRILTDLNWLPQKL